jgi:hypothetical protein
LALALTVCARPVFSQSNDETVRLAWVRDEGAEPCPDASAVQRAVVSRVGRDPFRADARTSIDAVVRRAEGSFVARFFVRGPNGEPLGNREFSSTNERCEAIVETVALALAIVIDPTVALRPDPSPDSTAAIATTPATAASPVALTSTVAPPQRRRTQHRPVAPTTVPTNDGVARLAAAGSFAMSAGALPSFAAGASIDVKIRWLPWLWTDVTGQWFAEQRTRTALSEFGFAFVGASLAPCVDPLASAPDARAAFALCMGVAVGSTFAAVLGQRATDGGARPWVAIVPSVRGRVRVTGPLVLDARLGVAAAALRASFFEELPVPASATLVFEQSIATLVASIGLGIIH